MTGILSAQVPSSIYEDAVLIPGDQYLMMSILVLLRKEYMHEKANWNSVFGNESNVYTVITYKFSCLDGMTNLCHPLFKLTSSVLFQVIIPFFCPSFNDIFPWIDIWGFYWMFLLWNGNGVERCKDRFFLKTSRQGITCVSVTCSTSGLTYGWETWCYNRDKFNPGTTWYSLHSEMVCVAVTIHYGGTWRWIAPVCHHSKQWMPF